MNLDPNKVKLPASSATSAISISDFSIVLLSKNHEAFISDCLKSIYRELHEVRVICVDVGSRDDTFLKGKSVAHDLNLDSEHIQFDDSTKTLLALKKIEKKVKTKFAILISADDAFGIQYREALLGVFKNENRQVVVNFKSLISDRQLNPSGTRKPSWGDNHQKNRKKLLYSNPGTAPGAVIPWQLLTEQEAWKHPPDILIEDYWIWWHLIDHVPFINCSESFVFYRQHGKNLSKQSKNKDYAYSLGYVSALPYIKSNYVMNRLLSLTLIPRWMRHLHITVWKNFLSGYMSAYRYEISL
jgi:glycosyltransferase involved in cell wall biosynthesis